MIDVVFDMETSDPDDIFTLCLLAGHPAVNLRAVTVTPGSKQQIGLIKEICNRLELQIPIGAKNKNHAKSCVSEFHFKWLGKISEAEPNYEGWELLKIIFEKFPNCKMVTGAALGNLGNLLKIDDCPSIELVTVQGGFAGDNVVLPENRLEKFAGKITCPTFNLNGDVKSAFAVLESNKIKLRRFVSKNICHGVVYDLAMHERIKPFRHVSAGISMMIDGMEFYLKQKPSGKAFHDPLAACCLIDHTICEFKEVQLYREKGEWGSNIKIGTNTFISVSVDRSKFERVLTGAS